MGLKPGIERTDEFVVEGLLLTDVGGTIGASVLSTPGMIGMIERNASVLAFEYLDEGKEGDRTIGVGTHERRVIEIGSDTGG